MDTKTQAEQILDLLRSNSRRKRATKLPQIMELNIANYRARISELRKQGYDITNHRTIQKYKGKYVHVSFYLLSE